MPPPRITRYQHWILASRGLGVYQIKEIEACFDAPVEMHKHDPFFQIIIVLDGAMDFEVEHEAAVQLRPGDRCTLDPGWRHRAVGVPEHPTARYIDLRITKAPPTPLAAYCQASARPRVSHADPVALGELAAQFAQMAAAGPIPPTARFAAAVWRLMSLFENPARHPENEPQRTIDGRVSAADSIMRESLRDSLSMEDLAERVSLSPSHLRQLFHEAYGRSPAQHLRHLRLQAACEYLSLSVMSIKEIASVCGFPHLSHFSRVFREELGTTPRKYRERTPTHGQT